MMTSFVVRAFKKGTFYRKTLQVQIEIIATLAAIKVLFNSPLFVLILDLPNKSDLILVSPSKPIPAVFNITMSFLRHGLLFVSLILIYIDMFIRLFTQEIEKNANELITEEEREKRKVEKRRAKKKVNTFNSI